MPAEPAHRTARAIAREELTRSILATARSQLAETGPTSLSLRAVARELQLAPSAIYRYFSSRDELLTALIINGYDDLGTAVEDADATVRRRSDLTARWLTLGRAVRAWAVAHPHDYALIYGSPVPGYAAPRATVQPATRPVRVLIDLLADAGRRGVAPAPVPVPRAVRASMRGFREFTGPDLSDDLRIRASLLWSTLVGTVSLEVFGHFVGVYDDPEAYFEHVLRRLTPF